jgi:hypothetical protein
VAKLIVELAHRDDGQLSAILNLLAIDEPDNKRLLAQAVQLLVKGTHNGTAIDVDRNFMLTTPFAFPAELTTETAGKRKLKSWTQIEAEADVEIRRRLQAALDQVRNTLIRIEIDVAAAGFSFFGATRIAGAAIGKAELTIDLRELLPPDPSVSSHILFGLRAEAVVQANLFGRHAGGAIIVAVEADTAFAAELQLDLEVPSLPGLDFKLPGIKFPTFDFPSLPSLPNDFLDKLLPVTVPLPSLGIRMAWTTRPAISVSVAGNDLTITTTTVGDGNIVVGNAGTPIIAMNGFTIGVTGGSFAIAGTLAPGSNNPIPLPDLTLDGRWTGPLTVKASGLTATPQLAINATSPTSTILTGTLRIAASRVEIRAKDDPDTVLAFKATVLLTFDQASFNDGLPDFDLVELELIDPYPLKLVKRAAGAIHDGGKKLYRLLQNISFPHPQTPDLPDPGPLIDRLERMLAAVIKSNG